MFPGPLSRICFLILGLLLVSRSDTPSSWVAILGFICLFFGIITTVIAPLKKEEPATIPELSESEKESLRNHMKAEGLVSAVRQLRTSHPKVGLVQAKQILDKL